MMFTTRCVCVLLCLQSFLNLISAAEGDIKQKIAFGAGNPPSVHVPIVEAEQSISSKKFFTDYVKPQSVVLFRGAIKHSRAFTHWSDDYFLGLTDVPADHTVLIESRKKENRTSPPSYMSFKEFVKIYNLTDQYMVDGVPSFLRKDYNLPHHLQCDQLMKDIIVETFMWFSSGGTSSVVHTDSVENLNCLIAGTKDFVIVPYEYKEMVLFDHPEGSYSGIDVDDVDYEMYPGLANVKFMHAHMEAGDCLYIPYKLIHQVRSFSRNIAVNIWWDSFKNNDLDLDKCDSEFDSDWTLERVDFLGFSNLETSPAMIRDHIQSTVIGDGTLTFEEFYPKLGLNLLTDPDFREHEPELYQQVVEMMREAFAIIDTDKDGKINADDLERMTPDHWNEITTIFKETAELDEELSSPPPKEEETNSSPYNHQVNDEL